MNESITELLVQIEKETLPIDLYGTVLGLCYLSKKPEGAYTKEAKSLLVFAKGNSTDKFISILSEKDFDLNELIKEALKTCDNSRQGLYILEPSIVETMYALSKVKNNDIIYLPELFADFVLLGFESLRKAQGLNLSYEYVSTYNYNIDRLKVLTDLLDIKCNFNLASPLIYTPEKFDVALSIPSPMRAINQFPEYNITNKLIGPRTSSDWVFLDRLITAGNENKRIVSFSSERPYFTHLDSDYRSYLVSTNKIEGLVSFPSGIIRGLGLRMQMIVLSSNNSSIRLVDGTKYSTKDKLIYTVDSKSLIEEYNSAECASITKEELSTKQNFLVEKLLTEKIDIEDGRILGEIASIRQGSQYTASHFKNEISNVKTDYCLLTASDIEDGMIKWDQLVNVNVEPNKYSQHCVHANDVIITAKSSKIKICVVRDEPKVNTIVTGGMLIVTPDTKVLNPTYLKLFLESSTGIEILNSITTGNIIQIINKKALEGITVSCPDIIKQGMYAEAYREKQLIFITLKRKLRIMEDELANFYDEFKVK